MKRLWAFFAALAVCTVLAGVDEGEAHDAAALVPVQALVIDAKDGTVFVTADTGDNGRGGNLDAALSDLQSGCAGALFTQTAEHVIVTGRAWYLAPQVCVSRQLRPAAKLYRAMEKIEEPEQALLAGASGKFDAQPCAGSAFGKPRGGCAGFNADRRRVPAWGVAFPGGRRVRGAFARYRFRRF